MSGHVPDPALVELRRTLHAHAVDVVEQAAAAVGLTVQHPRRPIPWSEDFGHFAAACPAALVGLGAGREHPPLHSADYDFPDELLPIGTDLLEEVVRRALPPAADSEPG